MNSSCLQRLSVLLALLALAFPASQVSWQGTGSMNQSVMAEINSNIQGNPISISASAIQVDQIAKNISTRLNNLWNPAWNVMIIKSLQTMDTIVYGYAFNNHWMWISGNLIPMSMGESIDYVIWKDYNCHDWSTVADLNAAGSGFSTAQKNQINFYTFTKVYTNVWLEAHDFVEYVAAQSLLDSGAYSVVMSQYANVRFSGYVCLVNTNFVMKKFAQSASNGNYGSYFLFQTR